MLGEIKNLKDLKDGSSKNLRDLKDLEDPLVEIHRELFIGVGGVEN